jgi:signal transduction histidine kinase
MTPLKILLLEDDSNDALLTVRALNRLPCKPEVTRVASRRDFENALRQPWDVALLDFSLPSFDGEEALKLVLQRRPEMPALVLSGTITVEQAVETLKAGAVDYISKDQRHRLAEAIQRAWRERRSKIELSRAGQFENMCQLVTGIAHDLRNTNGLIMMAVGQLEGLSGENERLVGMAQGAAERSREILDQLTALIRGGGVEQRHLPIVPLLDELLALIGRTFPRHIEIRPRLAVPLPLVIGNETQLHQVFVNLCVNARDALMGNGTRTERPLIEIEAHDVTLQNYRPLTAPADSISGRFVEISVADNGPGMSPEVQGKIFEPFFTTKKAGTGIGLWNTLILVREHHGFVDLKSIPGIGSKFSVYLPVASERAPASRTEAPQEWPRGQGRTVLLVDDELGLLELTRTLLQSFDYRVLPAATEAEAFALFRDQGSGISVLLTDLMMPGIGGVALIRQIRAIDPAIKVICITGANNNAELAEAKPAEVLSKPVTPEKLLTTLDRVCGG